MNMCGDEGSGVVANINRQREIDEEAKRMFELMLNEVGDHNPLLDRLVEIEWETLDARKEFEISESTLKPCVHKALAVYFFGETKSEPLKEYSRMTKIICNFKFPTDNLLPLVNEAVPLAADNFIPSVNEAVGLGLILHPKPLEPYVLTQCRPAIDRAVELQQDPDPDLVCFGWTCFLPPFLRSLIEWFTC